MSQELRSYEWLAVLIFSFLILMIGVISYSNQPPAQQPLRPKQVEITVTGAVEKTTTLSLNRGTYLSEALSQLPLLPEADLSKLKQSKSLLHNQTIAIPSTNLTVTIEGAIRNPGPYKLPKGTTISDLHHYIETSEGADKKFFKKKRKLKDQEVLVVPYKQKSGV